ncbi:MAG: trypsin-like peptidase domain-containing protein [Myxococcales bacterium]|nr:trypsin-like peptidase domain-containing protein [Myxococcales bacterium]
MTRNVGPKQHVPRLGCRGTAFSAAVIVLWASLAMAASPDSEPLFPGSGPQGARKLSARANASARGPLPLSRGPLSSQTFVNLSHKFSPAVVSIVIDRVGDRRGDRPSDEDSGRKHGREQGSGVIINPRGFILTNNHVVENAADIHVHLQDDSEYSARLIGRDDRTDMALIQIEAGNKPLPWAPLGDSDRVQIGEWVMAIGSPFGLSHSVTVGIVSAKGRREVQPGSQPGFFDFLQTDAPINPGNSGGPLFNVQGEVIGINSAMNTIGSGIGFAIPSNLARSVAEQLHRRGYVLRGWLGVYPQAVSETLRRSFNLPDRRGALVAEVYVESPAAAAGLRAGDVIVEFAGHKLDRSDDLMWLLSNLPGAAESPDGAVLPLAYYREGALKTTRVKLPPPPAPEKSPPAAATKKPSSLGLAVTEMTATAIEKLGYEGERGLMVLAIEPSSPAQEAGADRGDVVLQVNEQPVRNLADYLSAIGQLKSGQIVRMLLRRLEIRPARGPGDSGEAGGRERRRTWHNLWIAFVRK